MTNHELTIYVMIGFAIVAAIVEAWYWEIYLPSLEAKPPLPCKGDKVVCVRGSQGLSGTVVNLITLEGAEPQWRTLIEIDTSWGIVHEFPQNLKILPRFYPLTENINAQ